MQGRLLPRPNGRYQAFPRLHWRQEFAVAREIGFDCIEWVFDHEAFEANPLYHEKGVEEIRKVISRSGVSVLSVCADFFMRHPLHSEDDAGRRKSVAVLETLLHNCASLGIQDVTVPCVDESALVGEGDERRLADALLPALEKARRLGVRINMETDLAPRDFRRLMDRLAHPAIRVNYDIGNSASYGYDPAEEFDAYGRYVSVLHVKDRVRGGGSVKLGEGDADFDLVFSQLAAVGFSGPIIMQAARAESFEGERGMVEEQLQFLNAYLSKYLA